jgi:hypothetical protein
MTPERTVYRINAWAGPTDHRYISGVTLFYFDARGKLVRIDSRDRVPPYFPGVPVIP